MIPGQNYYSRREVRYRNVEIQVGIHCSSSANTSAAEESLWVLRLPQSVNKLVCRLQVIANYFDNQWIVCSFSQSRGSNHLLIPSPSTSGISTFLKVNEEFLGIGTVGWTKKLILQEKETYRLRKLSNNLENDCRLVHNKDEFVAALVFWPMSVAPPEVYSEGFVGGFFFCLKLRVWEQELHFVLIKKPTELLWYMLLGSIINTDLT